MALIIANNKFDIHTRESVNLLLIEKGKLQRIYFNKEKCFYGSN